MKNFIFLVACMAGLLLGSCQNKPVTDLNLYEADVIIYGGTSAAVMTAVQVVRMGIPQFPMVKSITTVQQLSEELRERWGKDFLIKP